MPSTVNTLRLSRRMAEAGMPPEQADAVAEAINDEIGGDLVTKDHLDARLSALKVQLVLSQLAVAGLALAVAQWMSAD